MFYYLGDLLDKAVIFGHYWIIQIRVQAKQANGGVHRQEAVEGGRFCS